MGKRKFVCDYNYFENIDTEDKAYWLGFIMADGCICRQERIRHLKTMDSLQIRQYLQISISCKDYNHLVKFSKSLNSTYPIHIYTSTGFHTETNYCRIIIEDNKIVNDLINQGIDYRKSLCKKYPNNLSSEFDFAFIRGVFDGDGCLSSSLSRHGSPEYMFNLSGTKELLTSIAKKLELIITDKTLKQRFPERNVNNYTMKFGGNLQTYRVMNLLYRNANIYLDRKYEKYLELCNYINSRSV